MDIPSSGTLPRSQYGLAAFDSGANIKRKGARHSMLRSRSRFNSLGERNDLEGETTLSPSRKRNPPGRLAKVPQPDQTRLLRQRRILAEPTETKPSIEVMPVCALQFRSDQAALVFVFVSLAFEEADGGCQRLEVGSDEFAVGFAAGTGSARKRY
jgi:hypothetical protein